MGQVCSGAAVGKQVTVARDPADKELDAVEMKQVKIPDFDSFFERAAAPLNEMVEIHNGIFLSDKNLQAAAAAMQGDTQLRLVVATTVTLEFWRYDAKEREEVLSSSQIDQKFNASNELRDAFDKTQHAIDRLNEAITQPTNDTLSMFIEKCGRLLVTRRGAQDALVRDVNIALFSVRKHLALQAHIASLTAAVRIFLRELAKSEDVTSLRVETNDKGAVRIMAGDRDLQLKKLDKLSKPAKHFRDALVDLLENVETAATSVPELAEQSNALLSEAQELPAKVPEAASSAGLGFTEIPKAATRSSANVKSLSNGPHIAKSTMEMVHFAGREITEAVRQPMGA